MSSGRVALLALLASAWGVAACQLGEEPEAPSVPVPGVEGALKSAATLRAERRLYDGAPPIIPHRGFSKDCTDCHDATGIEVPAMGFAPPTPHELTRGVGLASRCEQCHVYELTDALFVANDFTGLAQDLRAGRRLSDYSPPVLPHPVFMRENCAACHTGPAAREEIRTDHPERARCQQCHVERITSTTWPPTG